MLAPRSVTQRNKEPNPQEQFPNLLSTRTSICPDIPRRQPLLCPIRLDLFTRQALVVPVIPFAHTLRNLHLSLRANRLFFFSLALREPGQSLLASDFE